MRALRYALEEAAASLWRGRQSGILSTATIAVALFVLGGFLVATSNLERLSSEWGRSAELSVYLDDAVTAEDRAAIEGLLAPGPVIAGFEYVSKDEALRRFKAAFADLASAIDTLEGNPLPASYEVRVQAAPGAQEAVGALASRLQETNGVVDVRYDRQWLDRLLSAVSVIRTVGFVLAAVLTIAAALMVANVVRLALYSRRDEIEIMELVGAPGIYVRGPFVMEGVLQGGIGAVVALAALATAFFALKGPYLTPLAGALNLSSIQFLAPGLCLLLVVGGTAVGCVGGLVAATSRRIPPAASRPAINR